LTTGPLFSLNFVYLLEFAYPGSVGAWEASSRARRRADHGVAVNRAVDRIKIRQNLSGDSGDDAADPPAWKSNIGRHAIDAEKFPEKPCEVTRRLSRASRVINPPSVVEARPFNTLGWRLMM
jgi:hypothetical protein